jgi:hypothetical protein
MKKIGILHGMERTFPEAFVERVNQKTGGRNLVAEPVSIEAVVQGAASGYAVIIDRISQDVPFYRAYLKNAALSGTAVINNPFWWSADEKFFNNALATKVGVPVPNTVILPSRERPDDTSDASFKNLKMMPWEEIFQYIGFPAFMKPHAGGGWKNVYKVHNPDELFASYAETGQLVMLLQEAIDFDAYYRCYCIGGKYVRIMPYEPRNPHHLRYAADFGHDEKLLGTIHDYVLRLNKALGYDFNTVEFAVRNGVPIAIDFCNPAPDADVNSVGAENFEWVVETAATYAIERAEAYQENKLNLTWGSLIRVGAMNQSMGSLLKGDVEGGEKSAKAPKPSVAEPVEIAEAKAPKVAKPKAALAKAPKAVKAAQSEAVATEKPKKKTKK